MQEYENDRIVADTEYNANDQQITQILHEYDLHGRLKEEIDARNGARSYSYYDDGRVATVTTPAPGFGDSVRKTKSYEYDDRGRQIMVTYPDSEVAMFAYTPTGELYRQWGARTYPVEYAYDLQGRVVSMTTWQEFNSFGSGQNEGEATTKWLYDTERGWLVEKLYPGQTQGQGVKYEYTDAGRLANRTWARGVVTDYQYNGAGDLASIDYSDSTPDVSYSYGRHGGVNAVTDAAGSRTFSYYPNFADVDLETVDSALYGKFTVGSLYISSVFDPLRRLESLGLGSDASHYFTQTYSYESVNGPFGPIGISSRLSRVSQGPHNVTYGYQPNSNFVSTYWVLTEVNDPECGTSGLIQYFNYDYLSRMKSAGIIDLCFTDIVYWGNYAYNDAGQRIVEDVFSDLPEIMPYYKEWGYDYFGHVIFDFRYWDDSYHTAIQGQKYEYAYDAVGNRTETSINDRVAGYVANLRNQYEERDVPSGMDVLGMASLSYTDIEIELDSAAEAADYRYLRYFHHELGLNNSQSDVFGEAVIRELDGVTLVDETSRYVFAAEDPEEFDYDADGNLTADGRWIYEWDAENRLVKMTESRTSGLAEAAPLELGFTYDYQGRRIQKIVREQVGPGWASVSDTRFVYYGWNLIAELDDAGGLLKSYLWGMDIAEMQGRNPYGAAPGQTAGGVGGLLAVTDHVSDETWYPGYDGNGNTVTLANPNPDGGGGPSWSANLYEYDTFGNLVRATGSAVELNPFLFSTKYLDFETGLYNYGYRYYSPSMGRWLNRDPIEENGGVNLYAFVQNDPVNFVDLLGLEIISAKADFHYSAYFRYMPWGVRADAKGVLKVEASCDPEVPAISNARRSVTGITNDRDGATAVYKGIGIGYGVAVDVDFGSLELLESIEKDGVLTNTYKVAATINREWVDVIRVIRTTQADEFTFTLSCGKCSKEKL